MTATEIRKVDEADSWFHFDWIFQWPELVPWKSWNWRNFDVITLQFEYDTVMGRVLEIRMVLLGVGVNLRFQNRNERAVAMSEADQTIAEIKEHIAMGKSDEQYEG